MSVPLRELEMPAADLARWQTPVKPKLHSDGGASGIRIGVHRII